MLPKMGSLSDNFLRSTLTLQLICDALACPAGMLETSLGGKAPAGGDEKGQASKSMDTLTNLSAYLTLYRYVLTPVPWAVDWWKQNSRCSAARALQTSECLNGQRCCQAGGCRHRQLLQFTAAWSSHPGVCPLITIGCHATCIGTVPVASVHL